VMVTKDKLLRYSTAIKYCQPYRRRDGIHESVRVSVVVELPTVLGLVGLALRAMIDQGLAGWSSSYRLVYPNPNLSSMVASSQSLLVATTTRFA